MADSPRSGEIIVSDLPGDRWLVTLKGEHDMSTADQLGSQLDAIFATGTSLVVDLRETEFIDSSILNVLLDADRTATSSPCEHFALVVPQDGFVLRLFDLAGVRRVFQVFGSEEEAFAHFDVSDGIPSDEIERWMTRKQRIVKNEQEFRDYNNRRMQVETAATTEDDELVPFLCECGDRDCVKALMLTPAEFAEVHSAANVFIVKTGHVYPDVERLVAQRDTFGIVEKINMQPARASGPST
jgi:anti-anti-sigma factor